MGGRYGDVGFAVVVILGMYVFVCVCVCACVFAVFLLDPLCFFEA